ncbi:MAG: hypothetical protein LBL34_06850 [Clostridiales bacterium]|jgi:hypothetical protein|nr:hypothetical protein [Clostridiales bacterium]
MYGCFQLFSLNPHGAKKAGIDAKKAAIRAEGISKGVLVPVSNLLKKEPRKADKKTA